MSVQTQLARWAAVAALALLSACGGGGGGGGQSNDPPVPPAPDPRLALGDAGFQTVLSAVPAASAPAGGGTSTTLTIH